MKKLEKSVPVIRFKGFSEAWEQRKLGEVFTERSEKSSKGELISVTISSGVIKASELERKDISSSDKSNYKVVKKGDIAYNSMRMWQGASGHSLFDGILSPAYTIITPKKNISSKFISYIFKKHNMIQNFQRRSQGLTSDTWNLKFPALSGIKVKIPNYTEQAKISDFFQHIDNTIALHQRKLDALKLMKKGFLQQMFPKIEADIPEIRFADFDGKWEQRKLGEIFNERSERSADGELISVTINSGVVKASKLEKKDNSSFDKSNYKVVKKGDIAYNSMRMWQGASGYSSYDGILSPAYTVIYPRKDIDTIFIAYMFKKIDMIQTFQRNSQGLTSDTWNLKFPSLSTIKIKIPANDEQIKITNLFQKLEYTSILHQNQIEMLKKVKKAYLQTMFI
ncbi:restriction endonuclease subunit S [Listeria monocytogenes serotype 4c]|nr:restriction endonuclease subunit S [Listeria monocytogenes]MCY61458.1 restriction endonuclease subunit S [Listeria monocytogenes serotype 4c]